MVLTQSQQQPPGTSIIPPGGDGPVPVPKQNNIYSSQQVQPGTSIIPPGGDGPIPVGGGASGGGTPVYTQAGGGAPLLGTANSTIPGGGTPVYTQAGGAPGIGPQYNGGAPVGGNDHNNTQPVSYGGDSGQPANNGTLFGTPQAPSGSPYGGPTAGGAVGGASSGATVAGDYPYGWNGGPVTGAAALYNAATNASYNSPLGQGTQYLSPWSPINQGQEAALFMPVNEQQVQQNIAGGFGLQNTANYANAPQMAASPLSGLTTLGMVANANAPLINTAATNNLTAGQMQQINNLNALAHGQGPSLAEAQAKQQASQNIANQMAVLGSQRGASNTALGLRAARDMTAQANQQAAQQAVQGRVAEELGAQQQLTGALGNANSQAAQSAQAQAQLQAQANIQNAASQNAAMSQQGSIANQVAQFNAAQQEQTGLSNLQLQGATQGLNAQEYNAMLQAQMTQANNDLQAQENYANLVQNANISYSDINRNIATNSQSNMIGLASAGIAGGSALGASYLSSLGSAPSDRRLKTNITSGAKSVKAFLSTLSKGSR